MSISIADLFCGTCGAYAHLFLDACPTCGAPRASRLEDARRGVDPGVSRLAVDPTMRDRAERLLRTTALTTSHGIGSALAGVPELPGDEEPDYAALINELTARLRYRAWLGPGEVLPISDAQVRVVAGRLQVSSSGAVGVAVDTPLALLHGVAGPSARSAGAVGWNAAWPRGAGREGIIATWSSDGGMARLALGNSAGLFSTKARPDHYDQLGWWLGIVSAVAAERRWHEVGVPAHAAELGIVGWESEAAVQPSAATEAAGSHAPPDGRPSVAEALRTLEELRAGGLVGEAEYDAKRREILSRF
jgi:hypothetical protein